MEWAKAKLEALGATCALHDIGMQVLKKVFSRNIADMETKKNL